jgi:hypothetical protein
VDVRVEYTDGALAVDSGRAAFHAGISRLESTSIGCSTFKDGVEEFKFGGAQRGATGTLLLPEVAEFLPPFLLLPVKAAFISRSRAKSRVLRWVLSSTWAETP